MAEALRDNLTVVEDEASFDDLTSATDESESDSDKWANLADLECLEDLMDCFKASISFC